MTMFAKYFRITGLGALAMAVLLSGCSNPPPDVRLTLCRDVLAELDDAPADAVWAEYQARFSGYQGLEVDVAWDAAAGGGRSGRATCYYPHDDPNDYDDLGDEFAPYSSYPEKITFNGQALGSREIHAAVTAVHRARGTALLEGARRGVEGAIEEVKDRIDQ